jgi:hypothetical protein
MPRDPKPPCPFIETPSEECYVARLDSRTIERAIFYCGGEYEQCEIYGILAKKRRQESRGAGESGSMPEPERGAGNQK